MSDSISFELSKMQVKFRVYRDYSEEIDKWRRYPDEWLFSSDLYWPCESFCRSYDGPGELEIRKIWVNK